VLDQWIFKLLAYVLSPCGVRCPLDIASQAPNPATEGVTLVAALAVDSFSCGKQRTRLSPISEEGEPFGFREQGARIMHLRWLKPCVGVRALALAAEDKNSQHADGQDNSASIDLPLEAHGVNERAAARPTALTGRYPKADETYFQLAIGAPAHPAAMKH